MKQDEKELCGWFIFCPKQQLLLVKDGDRFHIPYSVEPPVQLPADTPIHTVGKFWAIRQKHVSFRWKH